MSKKKKPITIDFWSVIKKRINLIKIGIPPSILIFVGIYILIKTSQLPYLSDQDYLLNTWGLIIGITGVIWLIVAFVISGLKTFKKWDIIKKQKYYAKNQKHSKKYKALFIFLVVIMLVKVYLTGIEGYQELSRYFNWAIIIAVLWSIVINIKSKTTE